MNSLFIFIYENWIDSNNAIYTITLDTRAGFMGGVYLGEVGASGVIGP